MKLYNGEGSGPYIPGKIHHQAGRYLVVNVLDPFQQERTRFLSQEESSYQENIGKPAETKFRDKTQPDNKGNRYMYGQEPLEREYPDMCAPVSERDIHHQDNEADKE
jgi:hypothetical protein